MKKKTLFPEKKVLSIYQYGMQLGWGDTTTVSACSDPTTLCSTVYTTTHFI